MRMMASDPRAALRFTRASSPAVGAGFAGCATSAPSPTAPDPARMMARPGQQTAPIGPGEHRLDLDGGRDGVLYVPRSLQPGVPRAAGASCSTGRAEPRTRCVSRLHWPTSSACQCWLRTPGDAPGTPSSAGSALTWSSSTRPWRMRSSAWRRSGADRHRGILGRRLLRVVAGGGERRSVHARPRVFARVHRAGRANAASRGSSSRTGPGTRCCRSIGPAARSFPISSAADTT